MSAVKIIFKRSSLLGKRPTSANLEPGEIGLNTNSNDPGLFFEVNNGNVVKVGPTSYLPDPLTVTPALGELWVDSDTKALSIGTEKNRWQTVAAPFLGGTAGLTVFVAPEFPNATDSLANDGQTVPFLTINRAILEVSKQIIRDAINGVAVGNNRYLIILAPGRHCVVNGPGTNVDDFLVDYTNPYQDVTQQDLEQFNPTTGGLILPRGVSIIGMDLKKCEVHATYVPKYTHPLFPIPYQQDPNGGPSYGNQPLSSIFRWSGNTYVSQFNCLDKIDSRTVTSVTEGDSGAAILRSERPHGLNYNDFVRVSYTNSADQAGATFAEGSYYVYPVNSYQFQISPTSWDSTTVTPVLASSLPSYYLDPLVTDLSLFSVQNIYPYYVPQDGISYELGNYSHHRLSAFKNASLEQLNNFYIKVQKAFPSFFGGTVNKNVVSPPEYEIVAPTDGTYPINTSSNSTENSSPYQNMVNHRSDYGMANGDYDGDLVSGFKSVIINSSTAVLLQKDPAAYELYSSNQSWVPLCEVVQQQMPVGTPITSVPTSLQLQELNEAAIPNIRYYYTTILLDNGLSTGLPDPDFDFRHFGFRLSGPNSYMQAQSTYTIGAAIAVWAKGGAIVSLTNATTNFGSVAFQSEGFAGIGTLGGANPINQGFLQEGIVRPLALTEPQVTSDSQKKIFSLGSKVIQVEPDPNNVGVQLIYLQSSFDPATILPYSLKPGTAVFVSDGVCYYRAFFVTNGQPTCILSESNPVNNPYSPGGAILRVRSTDSNIPNGPGSQTCLDIPYIRRFVDPRTPTQKSYGFLVRSTNPVSQAPQLGSVLRLNQTGQNLSTTLKRNYQFDPGQFGGISQIFSVDLVEPTPYNQSVNFNNKISDSAQAVNYTVYASLTDAGSPWVQSVPDSSGEMVPYNTPAGSYTTYGNKNYFAAENNLWSSLYYETTFNPLNGPTKVSPDKSDSPFVITSVLENQEPVTASWQGYVPDPYYDYYVNDIPSPYTETLTYMRGATIPYQSFAGSEVVDDDDSTLSLGIIFTREVTDIGTATTGPSTVTQTAQAMTSPFVAAPTFGRPEVINLPMLQVSPLINPKNGVSILQLSSSDLPGVFEFVRVISLQSNQVSAIRNYYPQYSQGTLPAVWPAGTVAKVCASTCFPEPSIYDPSWSITKSTILRYYQLMGYSNALMLPYLYPTYAGERLLLNSQLPYSPIDGYATTTASWPVEFNNPSTVLANTHTWQYAGYFDYSRGLPKYQVNEISRKLQFDFFSTATWGGRLTVVGADQLGSIIFLGPIREALTGNFYLYNSPAQNLSDRVITPTPEPINYPNPVLIYSADDISGSFDGVTTTFDLTRGGLPIPVSQLSNSGIFVTLGGVMQIPGQAYALVEVGGLITPQIQFSAAPDAGLSCDIRVVSSDDNERTVEVVTYATGVPFDGSQSSFPISPGNTGIDNNNSFIFLSGVAQMPFGMGQPDPSYTITNLGLTSTLNFLAGAPPAGVDYDFRAIVSGQNFRNGGLSTVYVTSVDDISTFFDGTTKTFPLFVNNDPVDPNTVSAESIFVILGAVVQIPHIVEGNPLAGNAYTLGVNPATSVLEITFAAAPQLGTTCNIRVISSEEIIVCPLPQALQDPTLRAGDGVTINENNQIVSIDPGLINP